ncbi:MAG: hypothetical protein D6714_16770, partial [Bacteroidetes bacterium]
MKQPKSGLIELQYLGPVQYFAWLHTLDEVWLEQCENYQKGSYRNRCHILGANGVLRLTIPLKNGRNSGVPIREVEIAYDEDWQSQHWHSIQSAYGKSPFFDYYADELRAFYARKERFLFDFNFGLFEFIKDCLPISCSIKLTESFLPPGRVSKERSPEDRRNSIHPKKHRQKSDEHFMAAPYWQVFEEKHGFVPNLSILDLLFCTGPEAGYFLEKSMEKPSSEPESGGIK